DIAILKPIVQKGLMSEAHRKIAASLVKMLPTLALSLADLLCSGLSETVRQSLEEGIARSGRSAVPVLGQLLVAGTPEGKESALRILIGMNDELALREIENSLGGVDPKFHAHILEMLADIRRPSVTKICIASLGSKHSEVRCAAMHTLGKAGEPRVVSHLIPFAVPRFFQRVSMTERLTAIRSLGQIGHPDALDVLEKIRDHRPLLGRQGYELIRAAAHQAIADIRSRETETLPLAA
ncbi:MAG: HEAT repeat domain-containing protein, partial [Armatimonadota bacterium]